MARKQKNGNALDFVQIQAKLDQSPEKRVWRGLEELAGTPEYRDFLECEFPHDPRADQQGVSRRNMLKLMGASAALAGLTACTKLPTEKIVPYAQQQPENFVPGKPLFYATAMPLAGYATGLLVESHMGRPTKVEGNPSHPASLGAANVAAQASVLGLYDPDRAQVVVYRGRIGDWSTFLTSMDQRRSDLLELKGAGLRILTGMVASPALADQIKSVLAQFPQAKWHQYEPLSRDTVREGAKLGLWRVRQHRLSLRSGGRGRFPGRGFPQRRTGRGPLCARLCGEAPRHRPRIHHEPPLRGGKHSHGHGSHGGSPRAHARARCGGLCPRLGGWIGSQRRKSRRPRAG